ncbi:hypothetical protein JOQ06_022983 [Pogonophryne albipinna]|uniref:Ig-like domain-containing protein n=1 Tax=Pogonophryne albipinna TaxID=1090488 RepID=A0AAD6AB86_9TELE|nr:hypothetical protein JOQ06_022983 [Pogonophryne albipinna]
MLSLDYYLHSLLLVSILRGVSCEDLTALQREEFSPEGSSVTLSYRYSKQAAGGDEFYWYRQYPGKQPEFLLSIPGVNFTNKAESLRSDTRFFTDLSEGKQRMDLQISSAAVTDSAVYYCAVNPTVTGNTNTLYKNLWSTDNTILPNIHQRESLSLRVSQPADMMHLVISVLLAAMSLECRAQRDNVLQPEAEKTATKGEAVTLGCHYNTTSSNDYLFWYKQHGDNSPTFILSRFKIGTGKTEDEDRFSSTLDSSLRSVPLKIQKLQLSDSAVYYCALQPTVTGNTNTLYKNLWSTDNTVLPNIHQRESLSVRLSGNNTTNVQTTQPPAEASFLFTAGVSCEDITALQREEFSPEGSSVTLSYRYSKVAELDDYFFWYRQYPGKPPEFIISHLGTGGIIKYPIPGLKIKVESNQINLSISSAAVTDSAVFYCAVRPTVTGNTNTLYKNTS